MSKKNQPNPMDHTWNHHMKTLTKRKKQIEISETISKAISDWYIEHSIPEPNWKSQKDPSWWTDYLQELDKKPKDLL
jgi:hypothetical protein